MKSLLVATLILSSAMAFADQKFSCSGTSTDGTQIRIEGTGEKEALEVFFNGKSDGSTYLAQTYSVNKEIGFILIESMNDGLQRHSQIEFNASGPDAAWNTMKVYSVKTGKYYLSNNFSCSIQ